MITKDEVLSVAPDEKVERKFGEFAVKQVLQESARSLVALGTFGEEVVVLKRFRAATANPKRCIASARFFAERKLSWTLPAQHFVRPLFTVLAAPVQALVFPYFRFGSLDFFCRKPEVQELCLAVLALDFVTGVKAAHSKGVILRDIKCGNALVSDDGICRLTDLELAVMVNAEATTDNKTENKYRGPASKPRRVLEGTPEYLAPEVLAAFYQCIKDLDTTLTTAADVYSLTISLNHIAMRAPPYSDLERMDAALQTVIETKYTPRAVCADVLRGRRPNVCGHTSLVLPPTLAEAGWAQQPHDRPTAASIHEHLRQHALRTWPPGPIVDAYRNNSEFGPSPELRLTKLVPTLLDVTAPIELEINNSNKATSLSQEELELLASASCGSRPLSADAEAHIGPREFMEDFSSIQFWSTNSSLCAIVADGHGGDACAKEACDQLPTILARHYLTQQPLEKAFSQFQSSWQASTAVQNRDDSSGAAVVCAVYAHDVLHLIHVGDCRAVLFNSDGTVQDLCPPHTVHTELKRLEADPHAVVSNGRLGGRLALARALGGGKLRPPGLLAEPEITKFSLQQDRVCCLVLASDGLFDTLSIDRVQYLLHQIVPIPDLVAKGLVADAIQQGATDNVTAAVIYFDDQLTKRRPPLP